MRIANTHPATLAQVFKGRVTPPPPPCPLAQLQCLELLHGGQNIQQLQRFPPTPREKTSPGELPPGQGALEAQKRHKGRRSSSNWRLQTSPPRSRGPCQRAQLWGRPWGGSPMPAPSSTGRAHLRPGPQRQGPRSYGQAGSVARQPLGAAASARRGNRNYLA